MKEITVYKCDYCGITHELKTEADECELEHEGHFKDYREAFQNKEVFLCTILSAFKNRHEPATLVTFEILDGTLKGQSIFKNIYFD